MNAVEIEEAVSALAEAPFDAEAFPFAFLTAFGNKETAIKRLRAGATNQSDLPDGVLQRSNIHILVAPHGRVGEALGALRDSPRTKSAKARYILATDGATLEAEDLSSGETVACEYADLPNHFGFFLPLAGITTVRQIRESAFDIRATSRLNRLYIELLKDNPDWGTPERRSDMNHFMARLIFCFFAENTDIFSGERRFTKTVEQMSARDSSNTHEVIEALFRAMNTKDHAAAGIPRWADFPYVNGGLFSGGTEVPHFSKMARTYLLHIGNLDWRQINPDIFGSMIQAVADDEERGALGMHYTSVPNILKVLSPLFLDDLREQLAAAGENPRMLLNLRKRMSKIRVFDPACGSGNFLVIAYKEMRAIEAEINKRRGEPDRRTEIPLTNFRGIELREFPAEIARLALIIAEYQADELHRGQKEAVRDFLPLDKENWITSGNALRLDWVTLCPPSGTRVKLRADDLFDTPLEQAEVDFENEGGETYICGNPPFKGARKQTKSQKADMEFVFGGGNAYKDCDYVAAWYLKASNYSNAGATDFAFVSTNSVARGEQVEHIWSRLYGNNDSIIFCHSQFKWQNNAQYNAGVWCVIIGSSRDRSVQRRIFDGDTVRNVDTISPYLLSGAEDYIKKVDRPVSAMLPKLVSGNMARDGGNLILSNEEKLAVVCEFPEAQKILRPLIGTTEIRQGSRRWCLWIEDYQLEMAESIPPVLERINQTRTFRQNSTANTTIGYARTPHRFAQRCHQDTTAIVLPKNTVEGIPYLTPDYVGADTVTTDLAFLTFTSDLWVLGVLSSTLHRVWAEAISGGLGAGIRYSSLITYNAFPLPALTRTQQQELTVCAENIILAREASFPDAIANLYDLDAMPADLRAAHEQNDETLERIYIGRRFRNDTELLEKLFELYTKMTTTLGTARNAQPGKVAL